MEPKEKNNVNPKVIVKKIVSADRERVFDAWTKPELMHHWYVGGPGKSNSTVDLKVGGRYTNEMLVEEATCSHGSPGIKSYMHSGEYLEIVRPERLVFTWNSPSVQNTKVTVELREVSTGTEVTLTHELLSIKDCEGHQKGWTFALEALSSYLG